MEATRCVAPEAIILLQKVCFRNKPQTANRPQNLKMFLPNIQGGLQRKLDRYTFELNKNNPDILIATEHGVTVGLLNSLNLEY